MNAKYTFHSYSSKHGGDFNKEKRMLVKILGKSVKIEHIGSTAVPRLGGKGIIDVAIGAEKKNISRIKQLLRQVGYEIREKASTPQRFFFRRVYSYSSGKQWIHVHLTLIGEKDWKEMIGFRDYLLKHPETAKDYVNVKKKALQKAQGKGEIYRKYKETFIKDILRKAKGKGRKNS